MHALILMSDTGGGHRALSRAIAARLETVGDTSTIVDPFLSQPPDLASVLMASYGRVIRTAPWAFGLAFDLCNSPRRYALFHRRVTRPVTDRAARMIETAQPDAIVIAHAMAVPPALDALDRLGRHPPTVAMVTELVTVHASWIDHRITRYLVASEEVERALVGYGVPPERIRRTGLPVGPRFGRIEEPPAELRRRLRLVPDQTTLLVLAGGEGSGPVERLIWQLAGALPELQIVVVCGRNRKLLRALDGAGLPPTVHPFGFVQNVDELMHAADFVFTKGGPQSLSETLASGRAAVVFDLLPGQEQGNGAYVVRRDAGILALTLPDMLAAARRLAVDPELRARLGAAGRTTGALEAASNAVEEIRGVARQPVAAAR